MTTPEGLFRNPGSAVINGNMVAIRMSFDEIRGQDAQKVGDLNSNVQAAVVNDEKDLRVKNFVKFIFSSHQEGRIDLIQIFYTDASFDNSSVYKVNYFNNLEQKILADKDPLRELLYGLIVSYSLNSSVAMNHIMKKYVPDYKTNLELINVEKKVLYDKYKQYLFAVKDDKDLKESLPSPMRPAEVEDKERVKELLKKSMFLDSKNISLERTSRGHFQIKMEYPNFKALFENDTHRLRELVLTKDEIPYEIKVNQYISLNGVQTLPQYIQVNRSGLEVKANLIDYSAFINNAKSISERYIEYKETVEKNKKEKLSKFVEKKTDLFY